MRSDICISFKLRIRTQYCLLRFFLLRYVTADTKHETLSMIVLERYFARHECTDTAIREPDCFFCLTKTLFQRFAVFCCKSFDIRFIIFFKCCCPNNTMALMLRIQFQKGIIGLHNTQIRIFNKNQIRNT